MTSHEHLTALLGPSTAARRRRWDLVDARRLDDGHVYTQGSLALTFPLASGLGAEPGAPALSVVSAGLEPVPTVPDPNMWAARFLQAVVEVVSSDRPLAQLARWTDPSCSGTSHGGVGSWPSGRGRRSGPDGIRSRPCTCRGRARPVPRSLPA